MTKTILCAFYASVGLLASSMPLMAETVTVGNIMYTLAADGGSYYVSGCDETITEAFIQSSVEGKPVTQINQNVFKTASSLKSVTIPGCIVKMGNSVFQNLRNLETVTFEPGVEPLAIGGWTFNGCTSLREIVIPARLSSIGANSNFNGCTSLKRAVFEKGSLITDLKSYTFENCNSLEEVILPDGLKTIGSKDFYNNGKLHTIEIPATVTSIGSNAFSHDDGKPGISQVVFAQRGGKWPAQKKNNEYQAIIASDTEAYCYADVLDAPDQVTMIPLMSSSLYSTYSTPCRVKLPDGIEASPVTGIANGNILVDFRTYGTGSGIPAGTGLLLKYSGTADGNIYPPVVPDADVKLPEVNYLEPALTETAVGNDYEYRLVSAGGVYRFEKVSAPAVVPGGQSYLKLNETLAGSAASFNIDDVTTGVDAVSDDSGTTDAQVYNLMGVKMNSGNLPAGIYIRGGKKFIVR